MSTTDNTAQANDWSARMATETEAAEKVIASDDTFAPHDGTESDLNMHAADLLAGPDESFDPTRRA